MYRKIEDYEAECNVLRRDNADLRNRLERMQETLRKYQLEKRQLLEKLGIKQTGPYNRDQYVILEDKMERT